MRILLAIDDSPQSDAATKSVLDRPWPDSSTVRVLCVVETQIPAAVASDRIGLPNYRAPTESLLKAAQELANVTAVKLETLGLSSETCVREGNPRTEIVEQAEDWNADLIIIGSHGRTGVQRWLLGSVAEHVVRHAPCSVEVVRPAKG
jgi:nucleotide-binding universal stress UspA family protein